MQEMWETWFWSLGQEDPLVVGIAVHSCILAWRILWTGTSWATVTMSQVRDDWNDLACMHTKINDVEHLFVCLLAICMSLKKCVFGSFVHFLIELFFYVGLSFRNSVYNLDINPLWHMRFLNISSHPMGCIFTLLIVFFDAQIFMILIESN